MSWQNKRIYIHACLSLIINLCCAQNYGSEDLNMFLNNRFESTNMELTSLIDQSSYSTDVKTDIELDNTKTVVLHYNPQNVKTFPLFNNTFVLLDNTLHKIIPNEYTLMEQMIFSEIETAIAFIKTTEYNNRGFIFFALSNDISQVYGYVDDQWFFVQSIQNTHRVVDAIFFENGNNLYLIIVTNAENALVHSLIYKWTETHFDEINKILTKNASKLLTFASKESEIVAIVQNSSNNKKKITVFKYSNEQLMKLQLLPTTDQQIVSYEFESQWYLALFEKAGTYTLYWWNGDEFVDVMTSENYPDIQKAIVINVDGTPLILLVQKNFILILTHASKELRLIEKIKLNDNEKNILDISMSYYNEHVLLVYILTENRELKLMATPLSLSKRLEDKLIKDTDNLLYCLHTLEKAVKLNKQKIDELTYSSTKIIQTNEPLVYHGRVNVDTPVRAESASITLQITSSKYQLKATNLKFKLLDISSRLNNITLKLSDLYRKGDSIQELVIKGEIHAEKLFTNNLFVKHLNDVRWSPERWLSYSKPQTITGSTLAKILYSKYIFITNSHNKVLIEFVIDNESKKSLPTVIKSLSANNVYVGKINDIPFDDVYLRSKPGIIQGVKTFNNLSTLKMRTNSLNENTPEALKKLSDVSVGNFKFSNNLKIKNLFFEEINAVDWTLFKDSVFRLGIDNKITGNITFHTLQAHELFPKSISNVDSSNLLTTSTDQIITSELQFRAVYAKNLICNLINGIKFKDIITTENRIVKGTVSIDNIRVTGNVNGPNHQSKLTNHVVGTNETDLLLIYKNRVKILGNLFLSNILVPNTAKVMVNNEVFNEELGATYWLKNENQIIPTHFKAEKGIRTSHLTITLLNNVLVSNYLVNNLDDKLPTAFLFDNITILGNVIINETAKHTPNLKKLDLESVKITGGYHIRGRISIQGEITVGNVVTNYLDQIRVKDAVHSHMSINKIRGIKTFENVIVSRDVVSKTIEANILNAVKLDDIQNRAMFVDQPQQRDTLLFDFVTVHNIITTFINKMGINEYMERINNVDSASALNNVVINGNVNIDNAQQVSSINNYDVTALLTNIFNQNRNVVIKNTVRFLGNVFAENVEVKHVNNINFPKLIERLLYTNWDQNITASFTIDKVNAPNIFVPQINNIVTNHLISTKETNPQKLLVWGGIQLYGSQFLKSLDVESPTCNLKYALDNLQNPSSRYWNTIHVARNVSLWDENSDLNIILQKSVNVKRNNIIQAQVTFDHHISANTVYIEKLINNIAINEMLRDAVLRDTEGQIVTGYKQFGKLAVSNAFVQSNTDIPIINEIDILKLNENVILRDNLYSTLIKGHKVFFSGLQARRLRSNRISDMNPQNLITLSSDLSSSMIKKAYFHSLNVQNNLTIDFVNGMNLSYVLSERVLRNGDEQILYGTYHVGDAVINCDSNVLKLNEVEVDDIVLDTGIQTIFSTKTFTQNVIINEGITIELLNKQNVSESYNQAILLGENNIIHGNLIFKNVSIIMGNINTYSINGVPMDYLINLMRSDVPIIKTEMVRDSIEEMEEIIKTSMAIYKDLPDKYLYMETANELQISLKNIINARVFSFNGTVLLQIIKEEEGPMCGLPATCRCPVQESIQITEAHSINTIAEVPIQRAFNYENDQMTIHLFTTTVSTSPACRANEFVLSNESTSLMWMIHRQDNQTSRSKFFSEHIEGYISGVEFFHHNGYTYMIITRFYDALKNSHDIDCLVYKFLPEKGQMMLLQRMKINRAWTMHLFYTSQGLTLIIGRLLNSNIQGRDSGAEIYRFNEMTDEFMLLRKVPSSGCTHAVGVVVGSDSLIVLAQKEMPPQVLKYHPKYDNYYFYQTIYLDAPVRGLSVFYVGDFGVSDPFLCLVTDGGYYYVYTFQYVQGWQIKSSGEIDGLQSLVPFMVNNKRYLFAASTVHSSLLAVVKHGSN